MWFQAFLTGISFIYTCTASGVGNSNAPHFSQPPSERSKIESFKVMDVLARANELEEQGNKICHMEVGQPSSKAPKAVLLAAEDAIKN